MNRKDTLELKRRMKKGECTFTKMRGCYVDSHKEIIVNINETFLNLADDEFYKYLEIAKKTLSGTIGNNLLELEFNPEEENPGGRQNFLLGLRDSKLKNDALADRLFELIIENYDYDGNYLILLYHDAYDVIVKTNDNNKLDESEEVYDYLICSICPVELTKAALGYREDEHRIGPRIRDWIVSMPENGFVFPAFTDRSSDIHSLMFYTKTPKEPHTDFAEKTFGCKIKRTASEEKTAFSSIIKNIAAEDDSDDIVIGIHQALSEIAAEQDTSLSTEPVLLDSRTIENMRTNGFLSQEIADKIEKACEEEFGEEPPVIDNIVDTKVLENYAKKQREAELQKEVTELKSKLEAAESKSSDDTLPWDLEDGKENIILNVSAEKAEEIETKIIDGRRFIVIPIEGDETAVINGVETEL